jgi:hypothetical protein
MNMGAAASLSFQACLIYCQSHSAVRGGPIPFESHQGPLRGPLHLRVIRGQSGATQGPIPFESHQGPIRGPLHLRFIRGYSGAHYIWESSRANQGPLMGPLHLRVIRGHSGARNILESSGATREDPQPLHSTISKSTKGPLMNICLLLGEFHQRL